MSAFKQLLYRSMALGELPVLVLIVLLSFAIAFLLRKLFARFVLRLVSKLIPKSAPQMDLSLLSPATNALEILFVSSMTYAAMQWGSADLLEGSPILLLLLSSMRRVYRLFMIVGCMYLIYALVPLFCAIARRMNKQSAVTNNPFVQTFIERVLRLIIIAIGSVAILGELSINVNGLITGIGLGGLTFALAAQDTASNLFGGLIIISDRPFVIGDWISTPDLEGVVEDISFRSTRVRTFDDALVIVPNNKLSGVAITNWSRMSKRRTSMRVSLSYDTNDHTLAQIVAAIEHTLKERGIIQSDSIIVRVEELGLAAIHLRISFYAHLTALAELKALQESVNLDILRIVHSAGASFAQAQAVAHTS